MSLFRKYAELKKFPIFGINYLSMPYTFIVTIHSGPFRHFSKIQRKGEAAMKMYFSQRSGTGSMTEEDYSPVTLRDSIEKTRQALDNAYAGFDNAVDNDLIDSYIYEINSLQKRYKHLTDLAALEAVPEEETLYKHSPVRAQIGRAHV